METFSFSMKMRVKFVPVGTVCNFPAVAVHPGIDCKLSKSSPSLPPQVPDLLSAEVWGQCTDCHQTARNFCLKHVCPPPVGTLLAWPWLAVTPSPWPVSVSVRQSAMENICTPLLGNRYNRQRCVGRRAVSTCFKLTFHVGGWLAPGRAKSQFPGCDSRSARPVRDQVTADTNCYSRWRTLRQRAQR